jgi:hypothetical protein
LKRKPLWACPKCGKSFVNRNQWHSCGKFTVSQFLSGKGPKAKKLFQEFVRFVRQCGPVKISPSKTSISFMARVRFAGVAGISDSGMTISFGLTRRLRSKRIRRVGQPISSWYDHTVRITSASELDTRLLKWMKESYEMMGQQGHLDAQSTKQN